MIFETLFESQQRKELLLIEGGFCHRVLAQAVLTAYSHPLILQCDLAGGVTPAAVCACGCGRRVTGNHLYYDFSCRKLAQRKRDRAAQSHRDSSRSHSEATYEP